MALVADESFPAAFRKLLRTKVRHQTFLIMRFPVQGRPEPVASWIRDAEVSRTYPRLYTEGAYRLDPFYRYRNTPQRGGLFRLSDIAPDRFFSGEYYQQYYRPTKIVDEMGLLVPLSDGSTGHLSFSRMERLGPFRRKERQCLQHYSPLLVELLRQFLENRLSGRAARAPLPMQGPLEDLIRSHVRTTTQTAITRREAQIAALTLQGHSNLSASLSLGIARETAKVHRRNIYRKLNISSQAELFSLLAELF